MKTENILEYEPFREQLIKGLEEHYGGRAEITVQKVLRANGEIRGTSGGLRDRRGKHTGDAAGRAVQNVPGRGDGP